MTMGGEGTGKSNFASASPSPSETYCVQNVAGLAVVVHGLGVGLHVHTLLEAGGELEEKLQLLEHEVTAAQLVDALATRRQRVADFRARLCDVVHVRSQASHLALHVLHLRGGGGEGGKECLFGGVSGCLEKCRVSDEVARPMPSPTCAFILRIVSVALMNLL